MMDEQAVYQELLPLVVEVTGSPAEEVRPDSVLMMDLGAESLDLLDLCFLIEARFGIRIEANEFERQARRSMPGGRYDVDGVLTGEALTELRLALPEVYASKLTPGLKKMELPSLLTVSVFVHLIQRKLAEKEVARAQG